ncbi:VENN motif pre-toxin domain-containing protein [Sodalis ligni]|uniref:polymorphic toxin type 25 domain-containing protein n=1 Tax=Sodalis ligni TaxID=2697027 RepID=UPI001BDDEBE4|nr:polymorphic toxin type 25 domain-containing protein [Sodalis ligni]QWA10018.1 VENN motif pre-toxin domain-containing protein [Sodalis ligni]
MQGNSAAAGAAGGAGGELAAEAITGELYPGIKTADLTEEQKQTISTLSTLAAGLAGTVAGNGGAGAAVGSDAGKNAVDNNELSDGFGEGSFWGQMTEAVKSDATLAFDEAAKGESSDKIDEDIAQSHLQPSIGDEYKIHGSAKAGVSVGYLIGAYLEGGITGDKASLDFGATSVFGLRGDVSAGFDFGPYSLTSINTDKDYGASLGLGLFTLEASIGTEGIGGLCE